MKGDEVMLIKVMYCKYLRKDGSFNTVYFDTESKRILNDNYDGNYVFIEARMSKDVDTLREALIKDGYDHTFLKC